MPKKTRQEKILAQLKRLQQIQNPTNGSSLESLGNTEPKNTIASTELKSLETKNNVVSNQTSTKTIDYTYAFSDLRKTLIFVSVAIIIEIILSRLI